MLYDLIEILEISVKKHGKDKVLTLGHLLNILKLLYTKQSQREMALEKELSECEDDIRRYGSD